MRLTSGSLMSSTQNILGPKTTATKRDGRPMPADEAGSRVPIPELLAPAGDWECARAAVQNGADSMYFGLQKVNGRMRAHNFTETDVPACLTFLDQPGLKRYVPFDR